MNIGAETRLNYSQTAGNTRVYSRTCAATNHDVGWLEIVAACNGLREPPQAKRLWLISEFSVAQAGHVFLRHQKTQLWPPGGGRWCGSLFVSEFLDPGQQLL